jgi:hypothetical protein
MNDDVRQRPRTHTSATGHVPRVDQQTQQKDAPPKPTSLPEFPDSDGTTGFMTLVDVEGNDKTKEADDSATRSQVGSDKSPQNR